MTTQTSSVCATRTNDWSGRTTRKYGDHQVDVANTDDHTRCTQPDARLEGFEATNQTNLWVVDYADLSDMATIEYGFEEGELPRLRDVCFRVSTTLLSNQTSRLEDMPAWYVWSRVDGQHQQLLYRHHLDTESVGPMCLDSFWFDSIDPSKHNLTLRFELNTMLKRETHELRQLRHRVRVDSIQLTLNKVEEKPTDYNTRYLDNVNLESWYIEHRNRADSSVVWHTDNTHRVFSTRLVSDTFDNVNMPDHIELYFEHNQACRLDTSLILMLNDNFFGRKLLEGGKPNRTDKRTSVSFSLGEISSKTFKLGLDLSGSDCTHVAMTIPIELVEDKCREDTCHKEGGECVMNYADGVSTRCRCRRGHTGTRCDIEDLCTRTEVVQHCASLIHSAEDGKDLCRTTGNGSYACKCWPGRFEWIDQDCLPKFEYHLDIDHFEPLKSAPADDFFEDDDDGATKTTPTDVFRWMSTADYWQQGLDDTYHIALVEQPQPLLATIEGKAKDDQDYCLHLEYLLLNDTKLGVGVDQEHLLYTNQVGDDNRGQTQLCLRQFKPDLDKPNRVRFGANGTFAALRSTETKLEKIKTKTMHVIEHEDKDQGQHCWSLALPSSAWSLDNKSVHFEHNSWRNNSVQHSYLLSSWMDFTTIKAKSHRFRYQILSKFQKNVQITPVVFDEDMQEVSGSVLNTNHNTLRPSSSQSSGTDIELSNVLKRFRIGFHILVIDEHDIHLELGDIDFDDYCYGQTCSNGQGQCLNNFETAGYECKCGTGFIGRDCENIDYCNTLDANIKQTGQSWCNTLANSTHTCSNTKQTFECACDVNYLWDQVQRRCSSISVCLTEAPCSQDTEECVDLVGGTGHECRCREGLERDIATTKCVPRDACRQSKECGEGSKCLDLGHDDQVFCYCPEGFDRKQGKSWPSIRLAL